MVHWHEQTPSGLHLNYDKILILAPLNTLYDYKADRHSTFENEVIFHFRNFHSS